MQKRLTLRDERGATMIMVAAMLPVLLLVTSFAVDTANWWVHKRHLQNQVDAGALAGGAMWNSLCSNAAIETEARKYAGDPDVPSVYNAQLTHPEDVEILLNSTEFWNQGGANYSAGDPCDTGFVDIKATHRDLPYFFPLISEVVPAINAHARVSIRKITSLGGLLPVGVTDTNPEEVHAIFIDEVANQVIAKTPLAQRDGSDGETIWDNADLPLPVDISARRIGVRIALDNTSDCLTLQPGCYDAESDDGALFIRGWTDSTATATAPVARDVSLFSPVVGGCGDAYFSRSSTTCRIGVVADVDFGVSDPLANPLKAKVSAKVGNTENPLTYDPVSKLWGSAPLDTFAVAPGAGPRQVSIEWQASGGSKGSIGSATDPVQRHFSAVTARSGPIRSAELLTRPDPVLPPVSASRSYQRGAKPSLVVRITLPPSLEVTEQENDEPIYLRVAGQANTNSNESQTQAIDCGPDESGSFANDWDDELAEGCYTHYKKNRGEECPVTAHLLWTSPAPWSCVAIGTGKTPNMLRGLNKRILGAENTSGLGCTNPNNWRDFDSPGLPNGDPRIVNVFITPYGSFLGSGQGTLPITGFATLYITGWDAPGAWRNPCQPDNGCNPGTARCDDPADEGVVVGHFIKYVKVGDTTGGTEPCDPSAPLEPCTAVLTD